MRKVFTVMLSADQRQQLHALIHSGTTHAWVVNRARILLHADAGAPNPEIAAALRMSESTVGRFHKRFVTAGLHAARHQVARPRRTRVERRAGRPSRPAHVQRPAGRMMGVDDAKE